MAKVMTRTKALLVLSFRADQQYYDDGIDVKAAIAEILLNRERAFRIAAIESFTTSTLIISVEMVSPFHTMRRYLTSMFEVVFEDYPFYWTLERVMKIKDTGEYLIDVTHGDKDINNEFQNTINEIKERSKKS